MPTPPSIRSRLQAGPRGDRLLVGDHLAGARIGRPGGGLGGGLGGGEAIKGDRPERSTAFSDYLLAPSDSLQPKESLLRSVRDARSPERSVLTPCSKARSPVRSVLAPICSGGTFQTTGCSFQDQSCSFWREGSFFGGPKLVCVCLLFYRSRWEVGRDFLVGPRVCKC